MLADGLANTKLDTHYPYDLHAYLRSPQNDNQARQKDGFILISAGSDRVYGTSDDITSFGAIAP